MRELDYDAWLIPAGGGKGRAVRIQSHRSRTTPKSAPQKYAPPKKRGGRATLIPKKTHYHNVRGV